MNSSMSRLPRFFLERRTTPLMTETIMIRVRMTAATMPIRASVESPELETCC